MARGAASNGEDPRSERIQPDGPLCPPHQGDRRTWGTPRGKGLPLRDLSVTVHPPPTPAQSSGRRGVAGMVDRRWPPRSTNYTLPFELRETFNDSRWRFESGRGDLGRGPHRAGTGGRPDPGEARVVHRARLERDGFPRGTPGGGELPPDPGGRPRHTREPHPRGAARRQEGVREPGGEPLLPRRRSGRAQVLLSREWCKTPRPR